MEGRKQLKLLHLATHCRRKEWNLILAVQYKTSDYVPVVWTVIIKTLDQTTQHRKTNHCRFCWNYDIVYPIGRRQLPSIHIWFVIGILANLGNFISSNVMTNSIIENLTIFLIFLMASKEKFSRFFKEIKKICKYKKSCLRNEQLNAKFSTILLAMTLGRKILPKSSKMPFIPVFLFTLYTSIRLSTTTTSILIGFIIQNHFTVWTSLILFYSVQTFK